MCSPSSIHIRLVHTGEWWDRLALILIQGLGLDGAVSQVNLGVGCLLPGEGVLHPVLVITIGVVFTGMGTARFLAVSGGDSGLSAKEIIR